MGLAKQITKIVHEHSFFGLLLVSAILISIILLLGTPLTIILLFTLGLFFSVKLNGIIKKITKKQRPSNTPKTMDYSFPSNHAQTTSYLLAFFSMVKPITIILTLPLFLFVSYSRVRGKHHYLTDVVGGSVIGIIVGILFAIA